MRKGNEVLYSEAKLILEDLIVKLQHKEDYEKNRLLGQILVHYIELCNFKNNFNVVEAKLNGIIDNMMESMQ